MDPGNRRPWRRRPRTTGAPVGLAGPDGPDGPEAHRTLGGDGAAPSVPARIPDDGPSPNPVYVLLLRRACQCRRCQEHRHVHHGQGVAGVQDRAVDNEADVVDGRHVGVAEVVLVAHDGHLEAGDREHVTLADNMEPPAQPRQVAGDPGTGVHKKARILCGRALEALGLEVVEVLVGQQHRIGSGQGLGLGGQRSRIDHDAAQAVLQTHARVSGLGHSHAPPLPVVILRDPGRTIARPVLPGRRTPRAPVRGPGAAGPLTAGGDPATFLLTIS